MILRAENISKRYFRSSQSANYFWAVQPLRVEIAPGTVTVLVGRSGSGKTTLMHMLSGLLAPTEGKVYLDDTDLYALEDEALSRLRNRRLGVVPQGRSALDTLTVEENILLPQCLYGRPTGDAAEAWMEKLGILALKNEKPAALSGGELRRMAIARAAALGPDVIFADEPTGDLDDENTALVLSSFRTLADEGRAVFLVTHETDALRYADRAFRMEAGAMTEIRPADEQNTDQ